MKQVKIIILFIALFCVFAGCSKETEQEKALAESIAKSYVQAIDDYLNSEDTLRVRIAVDTMDTLLERADDIGLSHNYRDLYNLMEKARESLDDKKTLKQVRNEIAAYFGDDSNNLLDTQEACSEALALMLDWRAHNYSNADVLESFGALYQDVRESLGNESDMTRIIYNVYTFGMCEGNNTIVDMGINILSYDSDDSVGTFIKEDEYLFDDNRYEYEKAYPVYDLSTGLYGVYNIETQQYIYDPILFYLSEPDDEGLICIGNQGYYGCINMLGEKIVGLFYEEPLRFESGVAIVCANKMYGVIDNQGNTILETKYVSVNLYPENRIIVADDSKNGSTAYAIFNYTGQAITGHWYDLITFQDERIYAHWNKTQQDLVRAKLNDVYDLFDYNGNRLIGEGTELSEIWGVKLPDSYGIMIAECHGEVVNSYGVAYPDKSAYSCEYAFTYLTTDLQRLNDNYYQYHLGTDMMTGFNGKGYAIATLETSQGISSRVDVLLYMDGRELGILPVVNYSFTVKDANDYIFKMYDPHVFTQHSGSFSGTYSELYGVYIRSTEELITYQKVEMIDGTNLTIVQASDTQLYGLYDGERLVLPLLYSDINYEEGVISATRGAETITYEPQY